MLFQYPKSAYEEVTHAAHRSQGGTHRDPRGSGLVTDSVCPARVAAGFKTTARQSCFPSALLCSVSPAVCCVGGHGPYSRAQVEKKDLS